MAATLSSTSSGDVIPAVVEPQTFGPEKQKDQATMKDDSQQDRPTPGSRGSNVTAPKKQRKGPKGGTMKPANSEKAKNDKPKSDKPQQPKQKGPKPNKPKAQPKSYDYYYQKLAADIAALSTPLSPSKTSSRTLSTFDHKALTSDHLRRCSVITETLETTTTTTTTTKRTLTIQVNERPRADRSLTVGSTSDSDASSAENVVLTPYPPIATRLPSRLPFRSARSEQQKIPHTVVTLDNVNAIAALESLLERYGGVQHGGILDANYSFFVNRTRTAAISFIVKDKIAVVGGDPLCEPTLFDSVFAEFKEYRKRNGLGIVVFGGGSDLQKYGNERGWSSIRFGTERVLNPMNNPVLLEKVQKQVIRQNKQLLDPEKYGLSLGVYTPAKGVNPELQAKLVGVYEAWREAKNASGRPQSYTTIYDPFALPNLMVYIYTKDKSGAPNGFAALRKMGAKNGYYIDPCVAAPGAPRRITDLLYFSAMAMLNAEGCGYLSIGMEPSADLEISGFGETIERLARKAHARCFTSLKLGGKAEYYSKFRPDAELDQGMYIMFPKGMPSARQWLASMHFANISIRAVVRKQLDQKMAAREAQKSDDEAADEVERPQTAAVMEAQASASEPSTAAPSLRERPSMARLRTKLSLRSFSRSTTELPTLGKTTSAKQ